MSGYFYDAKNWEINLEGRGLPIPWPVALFLTPLMGAQFLMFLPLIGFAMVLYACGLKVYNLTRLIFTPSGFVPGEAYLTGHKPDESPKSESHELDDLAEEISRRRE